MGQQSISNPSYNAVLGRLLGMSGIQNPAGDLSPEISAVLAFPIGPEADFLAGTRRMSTGFSQPLLAANPTFARIRNPANSGAIAVVEVQCSHDTAAGAGALIQVLLNRASTGDRGNIKTAYTADARWPTQAGALVVSSDNAAASGVATAYSYLLPFTLSRFFTQYILDPGSHLDIGAPIDAINISFYLKWTERAIGDYEKRV